MDINYDYVVMKEQMIKAYKDNPWAASLMFGDLLAIVCRSDSEFNEAVTEAWVAWQLKALQ